MQVITWLEGGKRKVTTLAPGIADLDAEAVKLVPEGITYQIVEDSEIPVDPLTKQQLEDYAAQKRWEVETGGVLFNGMSIPTDDRAKTLIEGAADDLADAETTQFKASGTWVTLDGTTMRAVRSALRAHVKACFAMEASISADIQAENITTYAQIDAQNWPT